jgi:hypothetical protein
MTTKMMMMMTSQTMTLTGLISLLLFLLTELGCQLFLQKRCVDFVLSHVVHDIVAFVPAVLVVLVAVVVVTHV